MRLEKKGISDIDVSDGNDENYIYQSYHNIDTDEDEGERGENENSGDSDLHSSGKYYIGKYNVTKWCKTKLNVMCVLVFAIL